MAFTSTHRCYKFIETVYVNDYALRRRRADTLLTFIGWVWASESKRPCPEIWFEKFGVSNTSGYITGDHQIWFVPHQMNYLTAIHEITHGLGFYYHGRMFMRKYIELLGRYCRADSALLTLQARDLGIKV